MIYINVHPHSSLYLLVISEAEIVVGTEVEHSLAGSGDLDALRRGDDSLVLVGACSADVGNLALQSLKELYETVSDVTAYSWLLDVWSS
jgi:hypothetical protein